MTQQQLKLFRTREIIWDRGLLSLYLVIQIFFTVAIYLHDAQSGFITLAIITTSIKSIIFGVIMIEILLFADRLLKKRWVHNHPTFQ